MRIGSLAQHGVDAFPDVELYQCAYYAFWNYQGLVALEKHATSLLERVKQWKRSKVRNSRQLERVLVPTSHFSDRAAMVECLYELLLFQFLQSFQRLSHYDPFGAEPIVSNLDIASILQFREFESLRHLWLEEVEVEDEDQGGTKNKKRKKSQNRDQDNDQDKNYLPTSDFNPVVLGSVQFHNDLLESALPNLQKNLNKLRKSMFLPFFFYYPHPVELGDINHYIACCLVQGKGRNTRINSVLMLSLDSNQKVCIFLDSLNTRACEPHLLRLIQTVSA